MPNRPAAPATIFAPATAAGRAGVAVLRLSGPQALAALAALGVQPPAPRLATRARLLHPATKAMVDEALVLYFPAPHSFTGETVVELQTHGSRAVLAALCDILAALPGLRLAEPGEFARRAFANGKLDLAEIEGLADLIDAETESQRVQALRLLTGENSARFEALRAQILHALAHMEAYIDFPDEDIPPDIYKDIREKVRAISALISSLLADGQRGERIREGINVVILGAPNAGKSSLLNVLAQRDAAIVSATPGTTRDAVEVQLNIGGYAVVLVDTAGLRDSADPIEQEGVRRARARAEAADIKLVLFEALSAPDAASLALIDAHTIVIASKSELSPGAPPALLAAHAPLALSAHTGAGVDALLQLLAERLAAHFAQAGDAPLITRARHRQALTRARRYLLHFIVGGPIELACQELRWAAMEIGKITGKIAVDELLDQVFRDFCIGK